MPIEIKSNLIKNETVKLLNKFQILKKLTDNELRLVLGKEESEYQKRIARLLKYDAEETVIKEGDFDCWIFWVVQGEFCVKKDNVVVAVFDEPGAVFGEMSIVDEDSRSASVVAITSGVCVAIDMSVLDMIGSDSIKEKIRSGIQDLKTDRLNITTEKLVSEKLKMAQQQQELLIAKEKLNEKLRKLKKWKKMLAYKESKIKQFMDEHDLTEDDIDIDEH